MNFLAQALHFLSTDSLCLTIVALYTVLFLYLPFVISIQFVFSVSPVVLTTLILLLYLLRLGGSQNSENELPHSSNQSSTHRIRGLPADCDDPKPGMETETCSGSWTVPVPDFFMEWDVRAPLEVIYEECDEGDAAAAKAEETRESSKDVIQRYTSLSLFYRESDWNTSWEGNFPEMEEHCYSPESACFRWEEEDEDAREGLIEIELNGEVDEENLIEIDLSPARNLEEFKSALAQVDSHMKNLPATAQVAAQQGFLLADSFNQMEV